MLPLSPIWHDVTFDPDFDPTVNQPLQMKYFAFLLWNIVWEYNLPKHINSSYRNFYCQHKLLGMSYKYLEVLPPKTRSSSCSSCWNNPFHWTSPNLAPPIYDSNDWLMHRQRFSISYLATSNLCSIVRISDW